MQNKVLKTIENVIYVVIEGFIGVLIAAMTMICLDAIKATRTIVVFLGNWICCSSCGSHSVTEAWLWGAKAI